MREVFNSSTVKLAILTSFFLVACSCKKPQIKPTPIPEHCYTTEEVNSLLTAYSEDNIRLQNEIALKNAKLRKFNLIDSNNQLIGK